MIISDRFPRYEQFDPQVPVWCVTPTTGRTIHRFFYSSPFSPSGRYMALFRLPQEHRLPQPGEVGEVVLVDLQTAEERVVAQTRGWETQIGAHVQWGPDDNTILFNEVDTSTWQPFCVALNPFTAATRRLPRGIYQASPDGRKIACANLAAMRRTQNGYGVVVPDDVAPRNLGLSDSDGLYVTDVETGRSELLISIRDCVRRATPPSEFADLDNYEFYGFHCRWNPQGTRLLFSIRGYPFDHPNRFHIIGDGPALKFDVYTMDNAAQKINLAVPARQWAKGGHHTNWRPDGQTLSMNLNIDGDGMRFVKVNHDGSGMAKIFPHLPGSGHPTIHPNSRHILTDAYPSEPVAFGDGTVPIRLIDLATEQQTTLIRIHTQTEEQTQCTALRVDPHPAWDHTYRFIAFNGFADGTRRVYVANLSTLVG